MASVSDDPPADAPQPGDSQQPPLSVVTGGTSGVGLELVRALRRAGHQVVIAARSEARAKAVCAEEVCAAEGGKTITCDFILCDMSLQSDIAAFASEFRRRFGRCDVLINNAAIGGVDERVCTAEGVEQVWATNVVAYHLLALLLLDLLEASRRGGRLINVTSNNATGLVPGCGELFPLSVQYDRQLAYSASKQADRLLCWAQERGFQAAKGPPVIVHSATPRLCATKLAEELGCAPGAGRTASTGAGVIAWLATTGDAAALASGWHWQLNDDGGDVDGPNVFGPFRRRRCELRDPASEASLVASIESCIQRTRAPGTEALRWIAPLLLMWEHRSSHSVSEPAEK